MTRKFADATLDGLNSSNGVARASPVSDTKQDQYGGTDKAPANQSSIVPSPANDDPTDIIAQALANKPTCEGNCAACPARKFPTT